MAPSPSATPARSLAAILCADVHGYSRLMAKNEERTSERVTRSIDLISTLIGDYGGRVANVAGDGVIALFESAPQALRFAFAIQREFRNEAVWSGEDEPIAFRIGISFGEIFAREGNVQGHSINIAARIQALAQPGGICITEAVARAARDTLGGRIHPLGRQHLKNIDEPVEVFTIDFDGPEHPVKVAEPPSAGDVSLPVEQAALAVLPFENASGDPGDHHLCDGISRDIITDLTRFRDLLVIAPHSAFLFRNLQVPQEQIGRRLGVRYLVTGSLQRAGTRIRLRVQLSEAATERVLWSERYDGDLGDIFAFQDDVCGMIAARLAAQITVAERRRVQLMRAPDLRAYGLNLRAQELSLQYRREPNLFARHLFEQAAAIDPRYGRTYAGLSRTFNLAWRYRWTDDPGAALDKALELARLAITHDHLDARGFGELGFAYLYRKQHEESLAAYERAIELNPNDADILAEMGMSVRSADDPQRAMQLVERAMRLNPICPDLYLWFLGEIHFDLRDYEATIRTLNRMRNRSEGHRLLAASHALLGNEREARYHAGEVLAAHPDFSIEHWRNVPPDKNPEPVQRFIEGLQRAGLH